MTQTQHTPEEYLALEREAEYRSEYVNVRIYAMAGASPEHILIAVNVMGALHAQLREGPCEAYNSDMRVKTEVDNPDGMLRLDSVDCTLALRDIHDRIEF